MQRLNVEQINLKWVGMLLAVFILLILAKPILAQGESSYTLSRWSLNGSSTLTGGGYRLSAIAGQPEVSPPLSGDGYTMVGGFRSGRIPGGVLPSNPTDERVYLPIILRSP